MAFSAARTIGASVGAAGEAKPSMRWTEAMLAMRRASVAGFLPLASSAFT